MPSSLYASCSPVQMAPAVNAPGKTALGPDFQPRNIPPARTPLMPVSRVLCIRKSDHDS